MKDFVDENQRVFRLIPHRYFRERIEYLHVSKVYLPMDRSMPKDKTDDKRSREYSSYR